MNQETSTVMYNSYTELYSFKLESVIYPQINLKSAWDLCLYCFTALRGSLRLSADFIFSSDTSTTLSSFMCYTDKNPRGLSQRTANVIFV